MATSPVPISPSAKVFASAWASGPVLRFWPLKVAGNWTVVAWSSAFIRWFRNTGMAIAARIMMVTSETKTAIRTISQRGRPDRWTGAIPSAHGRCGGTNPATGARPGRFGGPQRGSAGVVGGPPGGRGRGRRRTAGAVGGGQPPGGGGAGSGGPGAGPPGSAAGRQGRKGQGRKGQGRKGQGRKGQGRKGQGRKGQGRKGQGRK